MDRKGGETDDRKKPFRELGRESQAMSCIWSKWKRESFVSNQSSHASWRIREFPAKCIGAGYECNNKTNSLNEPREDETNFARD